MFTSTLTPKIRMALVAFVAALCLTLSAQSILTPDEQGTATIEAPSVAIGFENGSPGG